MYIDIHLGLTLLISLFVIMIIAIIIAAVGWAGYIRELARNDMLEQDNMRLKHKVRVLDRKQIIAEANGYSGETRNGI